MIEQIVQVVQCKDDRLWVRMGSQSGCAACDRGNGCGAGLFAKLLRKKPVTLELERTGENVMPGQMLTLAFPERLYIKLVVAAYGWPLLAGLAGAAAGHAIATQVGAGPVLIDASALFCGLLVAAMVIKRGANRKAIDDFMNSLQTAVYFPVKAPNMCKNAMHRP